MLRVGFALLSDDRPFTERWGWEDQGGGKSRACRELEQGLCAKALKGLPLSDSCENS